jgi:integrase
MKNDLGVESGVRILKSPAPPKSRALHRLPARAVQGITAVGRHPDGGGLYLIVTASGSKNWVLRFTHKGRAREAGLGSARDVSLADARARAAELRAALAKGVDPLEVEETKAAPLFAHIADQFIRDQTPRWRDPKAVRDWTNSLRDHAAGLLAKPVDAIGTEDILACLRPIWQTKPQIASKVRGRIERILDAAVALGHRQDNPARWKGGIAALLPPPKKLVRGHHAALAYARVPEFVASLRQRPAHAARMLEFLILTAARSGEVRGARWEEIRMDEALWIIPANRMKAKKEHRVPLTPRAIAILKAQAQDRQAQNRQAHDRTGRRARADLVFPNNRGQESSVNVFGALFRRMGMAEITAHGFRSSFADWAGNETGHAREVIEAALAHAVGDATERAYRRSDALAKRRKLMEDWERFIEDSARETGP